MAASRVSGTHHANDVLMSRHQPSSARQGTGDVLTSPHIASHRITSPLVTSRRVLSHPPGAIRPPDPVSLPPRHALHHVRYADLGPWNLLACSGHSPPPHTSCPLSKAFPFSGRVTAIDLRIYCPTALRACPHIPIHIHIRDSSSSSAPRRFLPRFQRVQNRDPGNPDFSKSWSEAPCPPTMYHVRTARPKLAQLTAAP
jgi:hypothetical protein